MINRNLYLRMSQILQLDGSAETVILGILDVLTKRGLNDEIAKKIQEQTRKTGFDLLIEYVKYILLVEKKYIGNNHPFVVFLESLSKEERDYIFF